MSSNSGSGKILTETGTNELEIITFFLRRFDKSKGGYCDTYYGINAAKVSELIVLPDNITKIANSPECVEGVFLLRDKTIPLVDVCKWFNYEADMSEDVTFKWTVIVAELNGKHFGFITHGVDKVFRVSWESILPPHELVAASKSITGVVLIEDRLIQMIDFENITAAIDPSMQLKMSESSADRSHEFESSDKVVVIADDSMVIRELLRKVLTAAKFKVVETFDGQECWDYLQKVKSEGRVEDKILAIISDIEMPRMDGHKLCRIIKEDHAFDKVPVILFSSMINNTLRLKGDKVGADDQITKPEIDKLIERIIELVRQFQG
jgi:two-component system chemotaxis response regulator CheV